MVSHKRSMKFPSAIESKLHLMFLPAGKFDEAMQNKISAWRAIKRLRSKGTAIARNLERVSKLRSVHPLFKVIITPNFLQRGFLVKILSP